MNDNEIIQWLQNWTYSQYEKNKSQSNKIVITTIDNPGWGVTISLDSTPNEEKIVIVDIERTQDNWCYCVIKKNNFEGNGGIYNLIEILNIFKEWVDKKNVSIEIKNSQKSIHNNLNWMANWFDKQCDGDWEHGNGIKIETIDNPGWFFQVNLNETELQDKIFKILDINRSKNNWIHCSINNDLFQGYGGLFNLQEIFDVFYEWAEK